ncbi:TPA: hypothetical protein HA238_03840 [Candidatus Micrarchaeota archaeon]|nr:hypothetical protein [Candidatus Micrarchaeota archaeon]
MHRGKWNVITERTAGGVDIDYERFRGSAGMNIEIFTLSTGRSTVTSSICFRAPRDEMYVRPFEFLFLKIAGLIKINRTVSDIVIDLESRQVPILCVTPQGEKKWALSNRLESRIKAETLTGYRATPDMNVFEAAFGTAVYRVFYDILSHFPADKVGAMQHLAHNLIRELITEFQTMFDSAIRHFEKSQIPSRPV